MSDASAAVARVFREESGRVLATLIQVLGSFDAAEEAVQEALIIALETWPRTGVPANPRAWIIRAARNRAIDRFRRDATWQRKKHLLEGGKQLETLDDEALDDVGDERLRLIFTCCHPALALPAQVALTLRTVAGLTTPEIARAFLVPHPTMAQRLVRAKKKIQVAGIPFRIPPRTELPERLNGVLAVVYLVFTEGYAASDGDALVRRELCDEAIRLARVLRTLLPDEPELDGLLALMLLHHSRRDTREADGELVLLEHQERSRWDATMIAEGTQLVQSALRKGRPGPYQVQGAIAALHATAPTAAETDWRQIVALYDALPQTPVVALNRAAAIAMAFGHDAGLRAMEPLLEALDRYGPLHAARADLLRRLDRREEAIAAYRRAIELVGNEAERRFLEGRLEQLVSSVP